MLVKNYSDMNNNGKNKEHITSQANIIKFISTNIKETNPAKNQVWPREAEWSNSDECFPGNYMW